MAASSRMATQPTLLLRQPTTTGRRRYTSAAFSLPSPHASLRLTLSKPHSLPFAKPFKSRISASVSAEPTNPHPNILTGSTRTVTTLVAVGLAASKFFAHSILKTAVEMKEPLLQTAGPAFFAAAKNYQTGSLNTPLTVVAAGMAKWLDMYSGVLMVRVLLSWFPNIPWDRQPLSAIRDLCDPYLNLFRNIIPPIFDTLDVSPLLAFAVLGTLAAILNSSRRSYW